MRKSIFRGVLIAFAVLFGLTVGNIALQAQVKQSKPQESGVTSANVATDNAGCQNLANFLKREYSQNTKPLKDNSVVRLLGLQEKDAFAKAMELCAKLKAKQLSAESEDLYYKIPDGQGMIVIHHEYDDGIFVKLILVTNCNILPFTELWLVSLKRYNNGNQM